MTLKLFISHSSHTPRSRKLRDAVAEHLDAQPGIDVLWDRDIQPGQRWRTRLDEWLAECTGGVVLFSKDAIDSAWVLKEAQILTWRKAIVTAFPLVPVLLNPATAKQTGLQDWQPVRLNEIQFLDAADPETMDDAGRLQLATEIAGRVQAQTGGAALGGLDDPLRDWLANLADDLAAAGASRLRKAALSLGIGAGDAPSNDDPDAWALLVARRLLHFGSEPVVVDIAKETFDAAALTLKQLVRTLPAEARTRIADQFFPVWVNPDAARNIRPSGRAGLPIGINASSSETGRHYADRATFGLASERKCIVSVPDIHDGDPNAVWQRYDGELKDRLRLHDVEPDDWTSPEQVQRWKAELEAIVKSKGQVFVVLAGEGCRPSIVERLREKYAPFDVILLMGERAAHAAEFGAITLLAPRIPARREAQVLRLYDELI